jgi:sec-independent protein translocase protein TatC
MIFQIPIFSYSLSRIGILTPDLLKRFRRHAVVACLVLAAFLTPPDPISQVLIGVPLVILYEFSIVVSRFAVKRRDKELKKAFSDNED